MTIIQTFYFQLLLISIRLTPCYVFADKQKYQHGQNSISHFITDSEIEGQIYHFLWKLLLFSNADFS